MYKFYFWIILFSFLGDWGISAKEKLVKIACVGNSITYGAGIVNRESNSFPVQLGNYLGENFEVENFGVSGTTALKQGDYPYISTDVYQQSLKYKPDIVFIKLGTNDTKPQNRIYMDRFKQDYLQLIHSYRRLPSHPRIILLTPVRCFLEGNESISDSLLQTDVIPVLEQIAMEEELEIVNLHNLFGNVWEEHVMPDRLHPSSIGAGRIAERLYNYLTASTNSQGTVIKNFPLKPIEQFNFHGYKGFMYQNGAVRYYIVEPHWVANDSPWIWRARFWGHEPQVDIALLESGFYLTYCDVSDMYGSPEAVERWNEFYALAIRAGLNKKVVLEGMSRGGLIIYNWAASNLDKVACIYADAPVMDFKSWPLGLGLSVGSEEDANRLLKAYKFQTVKDALVWQNNPVDHAGILAKAKIPLLHVVGDVDDVVPVSENTAVFAKRLAEHGYSLKMIHKPHVGHHPHSLNNPQSIVDFILEATGLKKNKCVHPVCGNEYRSGAGWSEGSDWHSVSQEISSLLAGKHLNLLLLGNSITQGFGGNRQKVVYKPGKKYMDEVCGDNNWESAGISGDCTQHLLWRLLHGQYEKCEADNIVLTIGINNLISGDNPKDVAEGIRRCAEETCKRFPKSRIILFGVLPAGKDADCEMRIQCNRVHDLLAQMKIDGVKYVNPTNWFINPDGSLKKDLYSGDFIHLTADGYKVWCGHIKNLMD